VELGKAVGTVVSTVVTGLLGILAYKLRKRFRRHHETRDRQVRLLICIPPLKKLC
jgi:hypothetical protein